MQVLLDYSRRNRFVICEDFTNSTGVVSTFDKYDNVFNSKINIPKNNIYRVDKLNNKLYYISDYNINNDNVEFECIDTIYNNTDILEKYSAIPGGVIHFDMSLNEIEDKKIVTINPRLLFKFEDIKLDDIEIKYNEFKNDKLKIFSIMLNKGFILCVINKNEASLYFNIMNLQTKQVGQCLSYNYDMLKIINILFPIFNFYTKGHIFIKLLENIDFNINYKHPILLKLTRNLDRNICNCELIGKSLYIH